MSEPKLRDMIDFASDFCAEKFERTGEIATMWHAVKANGEQMVGAPESQNKDVEAARMRSIFEREDVVRYVFIGEAWILQTLSHDEAEKACREGLSQHPDRIEVVMICGEDRDCGEIMAHRKIVRPADGKPPYLDPLEVHERSAYSKGRLVGMLSRRSTQQ
jgi:hypothetical protein